jgi:hypothetical protein
MRLSRMLLALMLLAGLAGVAYVRQANEPAGSKMANAAEKLLASLNAEQKAKAMFDFDDKERFNWDFIPLQDRTKKSTRKGLPLENMTAEQKAAAQALLAAGTSSDGYAKATTIMSLESILNELEKGGNMVRNPDWYFFTIFGAPSKTGKWGWRVEGHHLSLNFAVDGGKIIAATPAFFGANPATVLQGPRKGTKTLMEADDLAKELFKTLDDNQKKIAYQEKDFSEIKSHTTLDPEVGEPKGLTASKMTAKQRGILLKLLQAYASRMPPDVAEAEMGEVHKAGLEQIYFAYSGGVEPGTKHTYRVQGPTFVIEFLNVQADSAKNPANHIHSVWRNTKGDFGITK